MQKKFKITWRHEAIVSANSIEMAEEIWGYLSLGKLDQEIIDRNELLYHDLIEVTSCSELIEGYKIPE